MQLQVQLNYSNGTWTYEHFRVYGAENDYRLHIGKAEGPSGSRDSLRVHNGKPFSTFDNDNDDYSSGNCATISGGGWWFSHCYQGFLTGDQERIRWHDGTRYKNFPHVEMKIRRKSCPSPKPEKEC